MSDISKLAPHSAELEETLLGVLLTYPDQLPAVRETLTERDFFLVRHGWIYAAICAVADRGQAVDYVLVRDELNARGQLEELGGSAAVTKVIIHVPLVAEAHGYARLIKTYAVRRELLTVASEIAKLSGADLSIDEYVSSAEALVSGLAMGQRSSQLATVSDIVQANFDDIETKRRTGVSGIPTGWSDLDALLGGLQSTDFLVVAGRPGVGKTSWLLSLFLSLMERGIVPALFSLEMSDQQIAQRLAGMGTGSVPVSAQRSPGRMSDADWGRFTAITAARAKLRGVTDDTGGLTPEQLLSKARLAVTRHGARVVMVDYLQLMRAPTYGSNRTQEVGHISHCLKNMAKELGVPVIAAAQLNRAVENRQNKVPQLSDLRESGDIENDADVIMFLYRDDMYNEASERPNQVDVVIGKHRHGPTGVVPLFFRKEQMLMCNLSTTPVDLGTYDGAHHPVSADRESE